MKDSIDLLETIQDKPQSDSIYNNILNVTINSPNVISMDWLRVAGAIVVMIIATEIIVISDALKTNSEITDVIPVNNNILYND
ncbi:hypothetical protein ULMS_10720 [Patiriisocius marinistellae]|uniref:Uncharacterized protein n=1 Tax=Patiriisocius marinistellae TaxID=2494560 RepID=A0A5J4FWJ0_9FLAO|nr:hypothetical protein [Patiriisocius marinistellae]GEQ85564.1 hypothetical protein ULMS_10720 [Patiriisocius marinistellae]